jgi:hypothetical protein
MSVEDFRRLVRELYLDPADGDRGEDAPPAAARNIAVLVDTSGSMGHHDPRLDRLRAALTGFAAKLAAYGSRGMPCNVCLLGFSEKITVSCCIEGFESFAEEDDDPLYRAIRDLRARGGTNYDAAFRAAAAWFARCARPGALNTVYFITDGKPTCYYHDGFTHCVPSGKAGTYVCNGLEFRYGGKGRIYYDAGGRAVGSNSGIRKYRVSAEGGFEVRVGSSLNWCAAGAVFHPERPARSVSCALPPHYTPGSPLYFDASGNALAGAAGAAYRVSSGGNFEQYRKGAWHEPEGTVLASALHGEGEAHTSLSARVQGGSGNTPGLQESAKSVYACREMERAAGGVSLFALGIGGAVDLGLLNLLDSAAQAQALSDAGQLAAALAALADEIPAPFSVPDGLAGLSDSEPLEPFDGQYAEAGGQGGDAGPAFDSAPFAPAESADAVFLEDARLLTEIGNDLLAESSELIDTTFSLPHAAPESVDVVRHFSLGVDHLDLGDILSRRDSVDDLLSRVTAGRETRMVNGEEVSDLVLRIHSGAHERDPVIRTIVLEDFAQLNPDAPDDVHFLLQQLLYG